MTKNGGGSDDDDNDDDDGRNNFLFTRRNATNSGLQLSPFTGETTFTHYTQDEDHGCRSTDLGIGSIRKYFTRRK